MEQAGGQERGAGATPDALRAEGGPVASEGLLDSMLEGFAHCRMLYDEHGRRDDFEYISVNLAFARLTGLEDVVGRRATEVLPSIKDESPQLLDIYGAVAETGVPAEFDIDFTPLGKWLHVSATRPRPGEFVAFFYDVTPRVRAEQVALEASRRLALSLAAAGAGIWEWDLLSGVNTWSDELWDLYDLERDRHEASYASWLESVWPEDRERVAARVGSAAAEGTELDFEWRVATRDGSERWLLSHGSPQFDADGRPVVYRGVVIDITQRKLMEQALRAEEAHKQVALDAAQLGVWRRDIRTGTLTMDERSRGHYGFERATVTFEEAVARVHPDDLAVLRERFAEALDPAASRVDYLVEYRVVPPGAPPRWLSVGAHIVFEGEGPGRHPVAVLGTSQDITERMEAARALREREQAYSAIFEGASYAMALMTYEGLVVDANPAFFAMLDGVREDVVGRSVAALGIADEQAVRTISDRLRRDGAVRDLELTRTTLKGAPLVVVLDLAPLAVGGRDLVLATYRDVTQRKLAEQAVAESRAKLDAALASMTDAVFISDAEGNFVDFNEAFATVHRFATRDECLRSLAEYPDILEVYLDSGELAPLDMWAVPRALRGERAVDVEYGLRRKDTGEQWIGSYSFAPIRDVAGDIVGSVVVGRDVSERKQAERDLAESELKFRSLFEHTSVGVFLTEPGGCIQAANPAAQAMFGYSEEEFRSLDRFGILDTSDPRLTPAVSERDLTGRVQAVELTAVRKDGERFPIEVDSTILPGPPPRAFVLMRDISWRKEAELALGAREAEAREMLERLSQAQTLGHIGDWAWDVATGQVAWSPEVYRIFGLGRDAQTTFDSIVPLVHEDDRAAHLRRVERLAADPAQASATFAFRIVRPDGEVRDINQTVLVERDAQGVPLRMYGLLQDLTELRRTEQALVQSEARLRRLNLELEDRVEQRTEQLRKANEELESFSYSVSHDLRAPLRHISGYSEMLADHLGDDLDAEARHFLDVIVASAREMGHLIDDLLKLSRLGRVDLHVDAVDMGECVRQALEFLQDGSHERVTLRVGDLPGVFGDHVLLRQVWVNLLENAFKYSALREAPEVEVGALAEDGETVFFVRDNGVGFDMAYADKLFAVFQRLHPPGEFEGTGIGLATVRRLVERHGGRVWAVAAVDEGATFCFTVPRDTGGLS